MVTFYWSVVAFVSLIFEYLNYAFPDPLPYYGGQYQGNVSFEMASLVILFPVFLILMRLIRRSIEADATRAQVWVRRWALVLTLFVAGAALAGDLITLVKYFFDGDVTLRFLLKVLVIFLVAGAGFLHFMADLRGYYERNPAKSKLVMWVSGAIAAVTILAGFFIIGTPWEARLYRFDNQKASDLMSIQWSVVNYWQSKGALPQTLAEIPSSLGDVYIPTDPQTGEAYEYTPRGPLSFELCATFNLPMRGSPQNGYEAPMRDPRGDATTWDHEAGRTCFERDIDPDRHPPYPKGR